MRRQRTVEVRAPAPERSAAALGPGLAEALAPPASGFDFSRISIGPRPFPHREAIEHSLGMRVRGGSVIDARSCDERGVEAFTERDTTVFRSPAPPLRVAAHEAAHLAQHAGQTRDAGLGPEGHAEAVAARVAAGDSARGLVSGAGRAVSGAVHAFTEVPQKAQVPGYWNAGQKVLRLSDDRQIAVAQQQKVLWAADALIEQSSKTLAAVGSPFRLRVAAEKLEGPGLAPGEKRSLSRVELENLCTKTKGSSATAFEQCDLNALDVMGAGPKTTSKVKVDDPALKNLTAIYHDPHTAFGKYSVSDRKTIASADQDMAEEILGKFKGGPAAYDKAGEAEKTKFDQQVGINAAAAPAVGQGFMITRMGTTKPGDYRHHAAGVVMKSGGDTVTMEAVADTNNVYIYADPSTKWFFGMYGSAAGQTFHDQQKENFGAGAVTMAIGSLAYERSQIAVAEAYDPAKLKAALGSKLDSDVSELIGWMAVLLAASIVVPDAAKLFIAKGKVIAAKQSLYKRFASADFQVRVDFGTYSSAMEKVIEAVLAREYSKAEATRWEGAMQRMNALISATGR